MKLSKLLRTVASVAIAGGVALAFSSAANAKEKWKVHSEWPKKIFIIGPGPHNVATSIKTMSGGEFTWKVFEPGALVPAYQYFDPLSKGAIDAAWTTPGNDLNKNYALAFFSAVPFGPRAAEYLAWMRYGGGNALLAELYARSGIYTRICNVIPPESSGWFRKEIKGVADMKGMKMRFFGLGAKVMEKLGVSTQQIPGGEIYQALQLGTIDATEFSMPAIDRDFGFYQIAKHNYFPGWHQQATLGNITINAKKWKGLSKQNKALVNGACDQQILHAQVEGEAGQFEAMAFHQSKGVTIHRWSEDMLKTFEAAWQKVLPEILKESKDAPKVWASLSKFRKSYAVWKDHGYLK